MKKEQEISRPGAASKGNKQKAEEAEIAKESKTAKKSTKSSEGSKTGTAAVKREKKVYELPGQTRETPDEVGTLPLGCQVASCFTMPLPIIKMSNFGLAYSLSWLVYFRGTCICLKHSMYNVVHIDACDAATAFLLACQFRSKYGVEDAYPFICLLAWQSEFAGMQLDPLRKFYMSLKQQRPESQMAKKW